MKWVKHDTDANQDAKLQNVLLDYGLEGYGLYWYCIELIAGKVDKDNITFELEHDSRIIARNVGSTPQKVSEMMQYFVNNGLFESSDGVITCLKMAKRLDQSMTSNPQMREIIGNLKNHDAVMTKSDKVMQDKIRLDKNIKTIDQSKIDREKLELDSFEYWWKSYPKKQSKSAALKAWRKTIKKMDTEKVRSLTNHIVDDCKLRIADLATGSSKFIGFDNLNGSTYINQERYNDDI